MDSSKYSANSVERCLENAQSGKADVDHLFPAPRYFQVHFEYIQDGLSDLQHQDGQLLRRIDEIERKLDRILRLLGRDLN
ncbi:hypothetical protein [Methylomonas albis]|uniref:Uncharacterized protein n=1 Tax=Methylomonas albis TaxID=1854563 RepID=A0ABR9CWC5_9GAMM|nr:hypothetical protein [Methylomonas albis]MBD9355167.1 hypothetical protein [Methylomonas albis]